MHLHPGMKKAVIALLVSKERLEMHYYLSPGQDPTAPLVTNEMKGIHP
jgi:hypothetical protein